MATRRPDVDRVALDRCELALEEYLETILRDAPARTVTLDQLVADLPFEREVCEAAMVVLAASARNGCEIEQEENGEEVAWQVTLDA